MDDYKRQSSGEMRENYTKKVKQRFQNKKGAFSILKKVFYYAREYRFYLYLAMLLDIINTLCIVFIPVYTGHAINCIVSKGNVNFPELYKNVIIIAVLSVVSAIVDFSQQLCLSKYNYKGTFKIRDLLFEKLQNLPISYIDTTSHGDLISRMINDIDIMTDGFLESFASTLSGITTIIGTLVMMLLLNIKLSIIINISTT